MNEPGFILTMPAGAGVLSVSFPSERRCFIELADVKGITPAIQFLTDAHGARLMTITCHDNPAFFELLHHLEVKGVVATLRSRLWKPAASVPSAASANPAAELIEQEISELYGITFEGSPRQGNFGLTEERAKVTPLRATVGRLDGRIDVNIATIAEHGSTTPPSRRVMSVRKLMGMPENPPLCSLKCPAKDIIFEISDETGAASRHPKLRKGADR